MTGMTEQQVAHFVQLMEQVKDRFWERTGRNPDAVQGDWHIPRIKIHHAAVSGFWNRDVTIAELSGPDLAPLAASIVEEYLRAPA